MGILNFTIHSITQHISNIGIKNAFSQLMAVDLNISKNAGNKESRSYCETQAGQWVCAVKDYVRKLDYGEVVVRVHAGKVVQVHKTEKIQFGS
ncbi:MAG: YezD family protein [Verrucomicrobiales bacterium]|jgi:hypothetical protein|nr:YezD family protein [Verrucomicrobiales bacterium]